MAGLSGAPRLSVPIWVPEKNQAGFEVLAKHAGWHVYSGTSASGVRVAPDQGHFKQERPRLVTVGRITDPTSSSAVFADSEFRLLQRQGIDDAGLDHEITEAERSKIMADGGPLSPVDAGRLLQLACLEPDREFPAAASALVAGFTGSLSDSSAWVFSISPRVVFRLALIRWLLAFESHPELEKSVPDSPAIAQDLVKELYFGGLTFVAPCLLTLSPWTLGVVGQRPLGSLILLFGVPLQGRETRSLVDLLRPGQGISEWSCPPVSASDAEEYLSWWVSAIDRLLGLAVDPGLHLDLDGFFDPGESVSLILSLLQLLQTLHSSLADAARDESARLRSLFDALDTLEGLGVIAADEGTKPSRARKELSALEASLPAAAQAVALPRCRAAVEALESFSDGFALGRRENGIEVPDGRRDHGGATRVLTMDEATARYLRLRRNAAHSYRSAFDRVKGTQGRALLASHSGNIPEAVTDLAFLYVLKLLATPDLVRPRAKRRSQKPPRPSSPGATSPQDYLD